MPDKDEGSACSRDESGGGVHRKRKLGPCLGTIIRQDTNLLVTVALVNQLTLTG